MKVKKYLLSFILIFIAVVLVVFSLAIIQKLGVITKDSEGFYHNILSLVDPSEKSSKKPQPGEAVSIGSASDELVVRDARMVFDKKSENLYIAYMQFKKDKLFLKTMVTNKTGGHRVEILNVEVDPSARGLKIGAHMEIPFYSITLLMYQPFMV